MTQEEIDKIDKCIQFVYSKKEINKEDKIVLTLEQHDKYFMEKAKNGDIAAIEILYKYSTLCNAK